MPVKITDEVRDLIQKVRLGFFATSSKDGMPNVSPKGSIRVLDENTLVFCEVRSPNTRANLAENTGISVLVFDPQERNGYQIKGNGELITAGPIWDKVAPPMLQRGYPVNYVVKITPESILPVSSK